MPDIARLTEALHDDRLTHTELADGSGVILDIERMVVLSLNRTGMFLVSQLHDGARSEEELADALCTEYGIDRPTAEAHVREFLAEFGEQLLPAR